MVDTHVYLLVVARDEGARPTTMQCRIRLEGSVPGGIRSAWITVPCKWEQGRSMYMRRPVEVLARTHATLGVQGTYY